MIELSRQLAGFPRHVTQHVGGMIVSATPLNEIVENPTVRAVYLGKGHRH